MDNDRSGGALKSLLMIFVGAPTIYFVLAVGQIHLSKFIPDPATCILVLVGLTALLAWLLSLLFKGLRWLISHVG